MLFAFGSSSWFLSGISYLPPLAEVPFSKRQKAIYQPYGSLYLPLILRLAAVFLTVRLPFCRPNLPIAPFMVEM